MFGHNTYGSVTAPSEGHTKHYKLCYLMSAILVIIPSHGPSSSRRAGTFLALVMYHMPQLEYLRYKPVQAKPKFISMLCLGQLCYIQGHRVFFSCE